MSSQVSGRTVTSPIAVVTEKDGTVGLWDIGGERGEVRGSFAEAIKAGVAEGLLSQHMPDLTL